VNKCALYSFPTRRSSDLKGVEELLSYRKISFDLIWWSETGLKIPNQAIAKQDDLAYVVQNRAGYLNKILVKVKEEGEKYSIVERSEEHTSELQSRFDLVC